MKGLGLAVVSVVLLIGVVVLAPGSAVASFVYSCTPVTTPGIGGGGALAHLMIYNPNTTTVNVAAKWLTKTGVNLHGTNIPCAGCTVTQYPGQTGANTVPIAAGNTQLTSYQYPDTGSDLSGNVVATIRVVSDLPVNVGWTFGSSYNMMCNQAI